MSILIWIWFNKRWALIIMLLGYSLFQTWQSNRLASQLKEVTTECQNKIDKAVTEAKQPFLDAQERAKNNAEKVSEEYEVAKEKQRIRTEVITREVQKIIERPVYRQQCIDDDGVYSINTLITEQDSSQPHNALP